MFLSSKWCWKFSYDHRNKLQFNRYSNRKLFILNSKNISKIFCCTLHQINADLVNRRDFFKKTKNLSVQKHSTGSVCVCIYIYIYMYRIFGSETFLWIIMVCLISVNRIVVMEKRACDDQSGLCNLYILETVDSTPVSKHTQPTSVIN